MAPSAVPYTEGATVPHALSVGEIGEVVASFAATARRARRAGFRIAEIHGAHGYLLHEFLSPLSNRRNDSYGGDLAGRARALMEVIDYKYAGSFLETAAKLCIQHAHPDAATVRIPNTLGQRDRVPPRGVGAVYLGSVGCVVRPLTMAG